MVARAAVPSVLIADADPYICRVFEAKLTRDKQFHVVGAASIREALQAAVAQPFDVVLWDTRLRDTTGQLARLRALCPGAALILTTTDDRPASHPDTDHLDVTDVLTKPFGLDLLVERIASAMNAPRTATTASGAELVRVGQQLAILSPGGRCVTRVLECHDDAFIVVGAPRVEAPLDFDRGRPVRVQVKGRDALYSFDSQLASVQTQPLPGWELPLPCTIRRDQRRRSPRRPLRLFISLERIEPATVPLPSQRDTETGAEREAARVASGITEDLCLGGCALVSAQPLPVGMVVRFDLQHTGRPPLIGQACILRTQPLRRFESAATDAPRYRIALAFMDLDSTAQHHLGALLESPS